MNNKNFKKDDITEEIEKYKKFAFKDNMLQVAIAFMIGTAFNKVIISLSDNIIMPILNYLISKTNGNWRELKFSPVEGLDFEIGHFLSSFIDFVLISIVLYVIYRIFIKKDNNERQRESNKGTENTNGSEP